MKNLKKFQVFALTQEEQKNVTGGLLTPRYRCMVSISPSSHTYTPWMSAGDAVAYCDGVSNCMGCESN